MCISYIQTKEWAPSHQEKTHSLSILQVPTTQLAKVSIDLKFVELTSDALKIFVENQSPGTAVPVERTMQFR